MWRRQRPDPQLHPDDMALVRRMRRGEEAAFEEFFETNFHGLLRFALPRLDHDTELAKELAQAAICRAFEKLGTYRGEAPLFSWLCSICRFEISGYFRRERRAPPGLSLLDDAPELRGVLESIGSGLDDPENQLLRHELARRVHLTIDHLPPHYAAVLEAKYTDGLSVKEIAGRLEMTPKAVESLLTRAREAFRDAFSSLAGELGSASFEMGK